VRQLSATKNSTLKILLAWQIHLNKHGIIDIVVGAVPKKQVIKIFSF
jgi:hypothetical protein